MVADPVPTYRHPVNSKALKSLLAGLFLLLTCTQFAFAQTESAALANLDSRVSSLEHKISDRAETGVVLLLFGAFCALWAQNTGRNPWAWFFLGALFNVITVLFLLYKNSNERRT